MPQDPYEKVRNTLTELQSIAPPLLAADGQVMTVRIEYPPAIPASRRIATSVDLVSATYWRAKWSSRCRANRRGW